jgi:trypsin
MDASNLIQGGTVVPSQVQYMISLQSPPGQHVCGATLIAQAAALTAAHCAALLAGRKDVSALVGALSLTAGLPMGSQMPAGGARLPILGMAKHPMFNSTSLAYDVAVVYLAHRLQSTPAVLSAGLPQPGDPLRIIGWGGDSQIRTPANLLRAGPVTVMSFEDCRRAVGDAPPDLICSANTAWADACAGDSGGPMIDMTTGAQVGVVSSGAECGSGALSPGMYASVAAHREWIMAAALSGPPDGEPEGNQVAWVIFGAAILYILVELCAITFVRTMDVYQKHRVPS